MSMAKVRAYMEKTAKDLGYKIDPGVFSTTLSSQSPRSCFVEIGKATPTKSDMRSVEMSAPVTVTLFIGKIAAGLSLEDRTTVAAEDFLALAYKNLRSADFKSLAIVGYDIQPFDESNEWVPVARIELEAGFVLGF